MSPLAGGWSLDELAFEGAFTTDTSLVIRSWNAWLQQHSGLAADAVIGRPLFEVFPSLVERRVDGLYRRVLAGEPVLLAQRFHRYLLPLPRRVAGRASAGARDFMEQRARLTPLKREGQVVGTLTVLDDVTERVEREQALEHEVAVQEALVETSRAVLLLDVEVCLKRIVTETAAMLGAETAAVVLREGARLRVAACVSKGQPCEEADGAKAEGTSGAVCASRLEDDSLRHVARWVMDAGQTVRVGDVEALAEEERMIPLREGSRSVLSAPMWAGDGVLGALVVESERVNAFSGGEERVLVAFALSGAVAIQNARLFQAQRESEKRFRTLIETVGSAIVVLDAAHRVLEFNPEAERLFGRSRGEMLGQDYFRLYLPPAVWEAVAADIARVLAGGSSIGFENQVLSQSGTTRVLLWNVARCANPETGEPCIIASGQDITERKQVELERERVIAELRRTLGEQKGLKGFIPICSGCKKIRDEQEKWVQLEAYIMRHTPAKFSHGICPECTRKYFPDLTEDELAGPPPGARAPR